MTPSTDRTTHPVHKHAQGKAITRDAVPRHSHRRWRKWVVLVLLLCGPCVSARSLDHMEHHRWTSADNGPSQVGALAQTRDGYLWLGSNESLLRFDGIRFVRYQPPNGEALGIVSALLATDAGLWVGLRKGGLRLIRPAGMDVHLTQPGLPTGVIYGLAEDPQGNIWAAANDGLARYNGKHWRHISPRWGFPGSQARAVFVDRDGVVWAANEEKLFYLPQGSETFIDSGVTAPSTSQIAQARDGSIWLADRYGGALQRYDPQSGETLLVNTGTNGANGLLFDHRGALWVATVGSGIRHVRRPNATQLADDQAMASYGKRDGLSSDFIWPLLEDSEGNVWAGTNAGLDRFRPRAVTAASLPQHAIGFALAAGADGSLYAGTANTHSMRLYSSDVHVLDMPPPVSAAMTDQAGRVWMAGPNGIWRSNNTQLEKVAQLPVEVPPESSVRAMALDAQGALWVSINRMGLFVWRDGVWSKMPADSLQPSQTMPVSATTDLNGRLWFGYRDNLLVSRDGDNVRRWGKADGLRIGHVTAISMRDGFGWVGGQRGVAYFDGGRFYSLQLPDNGLFDNVYAVIPTPSADQGAPGNDLWIHGKSGIFHLPAAELARAKADINHVIHYRTYDMIGGLANDPHQVLALPTGVRGSDDQLWFATSKGVIRIDPEQRASQGSAPKVVIESVSVDGTEVDAQQPVVGADAKRVEISYTALNLSVPEAMHFRYRLDGFDNDWHHAGVQRQATYTGLGAGDYRFRVVALNHDGVASLDEATLSFSVAQVFYLNPLFLLACAALLIGLLWCLYRASLRHSARQLRARLEERHAERERIARELHDTLLQGVQGLMLRFQAVAQAIPDENPARSKMEQALDRADQVLADGRDRVFNLRSAHPPPADLLAALIAAAREFEQHTAVELSACAEGARQPLQPIAREELYRIGHEAIANAFRHSQGKHVTLQITYTRRAFELRVTDDGKGIEPAYLETGRQKHWGLCGMRERTQRIGGRLTIGAAQPHGTEVRLVLPGACAYQRPPGPLERGWHRLTSARRSACKQINPSE